MQYLVKLIFIFIISYQSAYSQIAGFYRFDMGSYSFNLNITDKNRYSIELVRICTEDLPQIMLLSYGITEKKGDSVRLIDNLYSYKIILKKVKNDLIVLQGYKFMKSQKIPFVTKYFEDSRLNDLFSSSKNIKNNLVNKKAEFNIKNTLSNNLNTGTFECKQFICGHVNERGLIMEITKNNEFNYSFNNFPLANGKWKRKGNILYCYDKNLKYWFSLFIEKDGSLRSRSLIGAYFIDFIFLKTELSKYD